MSTTDKNVIPSMETSIQETYTLPSRGKIYPDMDVPEEITLRAMTTFEEKMRLGSTSFYKTMCNIIHRCLVGCDFDVSKLAVFDFQYLLYMLRVVTYGAEYKVDAMCPTCRGTQSFVVSLDNLEVNMMSDKDTENEGLFEVGPLPVSKDVITCRYLRINEFDEIEQKARAIRRKNPNYEGDASYMLYMQYKIVSVNGKSLSLPELEKYVSTMNARDTNYFNRKYDQHDQFGIQLVVNETCPSCGSEMEFLLPFTQEFFRPSYDD